MKHQPFGRSYACYFLFCASLLAILHPLEASAGAMRLVMNDGTSIEVPYYWEEAGEIRFEIAGGVVGIPRDQVKSVKEILTARELDLDSGGEVKEASPTSPGTQQEMLRNLVAASLPAQSASEKLNPEERSKALADREASRKGMTLSKEKTHGPLFNIEGDFSELVKTPSGDLVYMVRSVLSSRRDLRNYSFILSLYDAEGSVIEQKPCEIQPIEVDKKTMVKLAIHGRLYALSSPVKPDSKIRRYDITALQK